MNATQLQATTTAKGFNNLCQASLPHLHPPVATASRTALHACSLFTWLRTHVLRQTWQCGVNRRCVPPFFFVHYPLHRRGLILGNAPPPANQGLCPLSSVLKETDLPRAQISIFFVCFLCLPVSFSIASRASMCPEERVYVLCESWRQVIKERLQSRSCKWNKKKKYPTFVEEDEEVDLLLKTNRTISSTFPVLRTP